MKEKNKRKEIIIIGVLILLMIVIIVGTSYAALRYGGIGNSYLNPGSSDMWYWSMTPAHFDTGFAVVWNEIEFLNYNTVNNYGYDGLRPVINVVTDNGFTSGDGSASNPYVITAE